MVDIAGFVCYGQGCYAQNKKERLMSHKLGIEEVAILIKPLGEGRIETCIYKSDENTMDDEDLDVALNVALTMNALFELAMDEESDLITELRDKVQDKIDEIIEGDYDDELDVAPSYTSEGNILKINKFTKTKGSC